MNTRDARSRMFDDKLKIVQAQYEEELTIAEKKWEFRYNNQLNTIRDLEHAAKGLRDKNRELMKQIGEMKDADIS